MAYTNILRCENNKLYVGSIIDINVRAVRKKSGRCTVYTKHHKPEEVIYTEEYETCQEVLITGDIEKLKQFLKTK